MSVEEAEARSRRYWGGAPPPDPAQAEATLADGTFGMRFMAWASKQGMTPDRLVSAVEKQAGSTAFGRGGAAYVGPPSDTARYLAGNPPNMGTAFGGPPPSVGTGANRLVSAQMGPGEPAPPFPLGGDPRQFQYRVGYNFPTPPDSDRQMDSSLLRSLADTYDLLRRCIQIRKDEVATMEWDIVPTEPNRKKREAWMEQNATKIEDIKRFFKWPEAYVSRDANFEWQRRGIKDWGSWISALIEDYFVGDWLTVWPRHTLSGQLFSLERIAGENIKPLLDLDARTPTPPDPAYQQYLYGVPRASFTLDELLYRPRNVRNWTPYGFSHVEQMLLVIMLALRFEMWNVQAYTDGALPLGVLAFPDGYSPEMIRQVVDVMNQAAGLSDERQQWRGVPFGTKWMDIKTFNWDESFALYLVEYTAAMMDVSPAELGFYPSRGGSGLGGSGFAQQQDVWVQRKSTRPLALWIQGIHNEIIDRYFGRTDLEFQFMGLEDEDQNEDLDADRKELELGVRSLDDLLQERGEEPVGVERFVVIGTVPWFVSDLKKAQEGKGRIGGPAPGLPTSDDIQEQNEAMAANMQQGGDDGGPGDDGGASASPGGDEGSSPPSDDSDSSGPPTTDHPGPNTNAPDSEKAASLAPNTAKFDTSSGMQPHGLVSLTGLDPTTPAGKEFRQWRRKAVKAAKAGTRARFEAVDLDPDLVMRVRSALDEAPADDVDAVKAAFDSELGGEDGGLTKAARRGSPIAAGVAVRAQNTGRLLLMQRALGDGHGKKDPAAGKWEFPGGRIEPGETPRLAAVREWQEETGAELPDGRFADTWDQPNGKYRGFLYLIPTESDLPINLDTEDRKHPNPDDSDGDLTETLAWFDPKDLPDMPALRDEVRDSPWDTLTKAALMRPF